MSRLYFILGTVLVFCACAPTIIVENHMPLLDESGATFAIVAPRHSAIGNAGAHHDGILAVEQYSYVVGSTLETSAIKTQVGMILTNQMMDAGYNVVDMSSTILTESMAENLDYSVAINITSMKVDTYAPLCGNKTTSSIEASYSITDLSNASVVYTATCAGLSSVSGDDPLSGIVSAVQNSVRMFLADPRLQTAISN